MRVSNHVFRYGGHIGLHTIIGGVDCKGPQLIECQHDGNQFAGPYLTMGSGCLAAMGVFESRYKDNMTKEEALETCVAAIEAGIYHDLGSGSNVDLCFITKDGHEILRNYKHDN